MTRHLVALDGHRSAATAIDKSGIAGAQIRRVDTTRRLRPFPGYGERIEPRFQAFLMPERTGQQRKPLTYLRSSMQRIVPCAISATQKLWRKRYVKR